jgi:hypothetical protein
MAQEPGEIKEHIEAEREKLGEDLNEIEHRMKDAVDWRVWYENHTALLLGAAVAGGVLLSTIVGPSLAGHESDGAADTDWDGEWRGESSIRPVSPPVSEAKRSNQFSRIGNVLDNTVAALVGVAASKLQDFVSDSIPGFREQYSEAERRRFG